MKDKIPRARFALGVEDVARGVGAGPGEVINVVIEEAYGITAPS